MPTISTTARRLRAYQAALDRLARPARPTTASRRCARQRAPTGDGTLHALLTASTYFTLAYIYVVIGSKDLLTSIEVPRTTFAVLYPVYLTLTPATLRPLPSFDIPQLQHPERHILHPCKCSAPAYCYLLWVNERPSVQDLHALLPALSYRHSYTNLCYGQLSILCAIESNDKSCLCTTQTLASCATANTTSKPLQ